MDLFRMKNLHHLTSEILVVNGIFPEIIKNVYCFRRQKSTSKKKRPFIAESSRLLR